MKTNVTESIPAPHRSADRKPVGMAAFAALAMQQFFIQ